MLEIEGSTFSSLEDDAGALFLLLKVCDTLFLSLEHDGELFPPLEDNWLLGTDVNTSASLEDEERVSLLFVDDRVFLLPLEITGISTLEDDDLLVLLFEVDGKADGLLPSLRVEGS